MRAIIIAAGEATRWNNYTGVAKHFVKLCSEPILHRTVRLLHENNVDDIWVVGLTEEYKIEHSKLYVPTINYDENADADKFLSSKELWHTDDRTVVLYGDCYFSEKAIQTIVNYQTKEWTLFCRPGPSKITGTPYGECFAQSFYPEHLEKHEKNLHRIASLYKAGELHRCGGWEHYRAMIHEDNSKLNVHRMSTNYVEINDWTEDFDVPADYDNWTRNRKNMLNKKKKAFFDFGPGVLNSEAWDKKWEDYTIIGIEPDIERYNTLLPTYPGLLLNCAVSDELGEITGIIHSTSGFIANGYPGYSKEYTIKSITADWLDTEYGPFDKISIWADIEGSEIRMLNGAKNILEKTESVTVECHSEPRTKEWARSSDIFKLLLNCGFSTTNKERVNIARNINYDVTFTKQLYEKNKNKKYQH